MTDREWMRQALALAALGEGSTSPNPRVGCVVVRDGRAVGTGFHRACGEPHQAELRGELRRHGARAHKAIADARMLVDNLSQDSRLVLDRARAGRELGNARRLGVRGDAARHDEIVEITATERRLRCAEPELFEA